MSFFCHVKKCINIGKYIAMNSEGLNITSYEAIKSHVLKTSYYATAPITKSCNSDGEGWQFLFKPINTEETSWPNYKRHQQKAMHDQRKGDII
jgi:hypothetical protein